MNRNQQITSMADVKSRTPRDDQQDVEGCVTRRRIRNVDASECLDSQSQLAQYENCRSWLASGPVWGSVTAAPYETFNLEFDNLCTLQQRSVYRVSIRIAYIRPQRVVSSPGNSIAN
jgi:hypothetical protein